MAGNSSAGRAVVQSLGGEAAPAWPKPYTLKSRNCCCLEPCTFFCLLWAHCRFGSWYLLVETSSLPPGICWVSLWVQGRAEGPQWVPTASLCPAWADFAGQGLQGCGDSAGGLGMETFVLCQGFSVFCSPSIACALPFLCAYEQRKNNFLCNLAPGNPIPDKL